MMQRMFGALFTLFVLLRTRTSANEACELLDEAEQEIKPACLLQVGAGKGGRVSFRPQARKIPVEIYYETQCPFCHVFLNTTLRLMWDDKKLRELIDLKLYPFGNAAYLTKEMVSRGYHFWHPQASYPLLMCQHGESECLGNSIHACAMDVLQDSAKYVPFIICMSAFEPGTGMELSSYECGKQLGIDMSNIKACVNSKRGVNLINAVGNATLASNITHVPYVTVDGKHTENDTLLMPVCDLLPEPKPEVCPELTMEAGRRRRRRKAEEAKHGGSGPCLLSLAPL
jgi:interferon gamma-inducible protein 30